MCERIFTYGRKIAKFFLEGLEKFFFDIFLRFQKVVGRQQRVFRGERCVRDGREGVLNISGLEPARLYTFAVRNVSCELQALASAPLGLRITTRKFYAPKNRSRNFFLEILESWKKS